MRISRIQPGCGDFQLNGGGYLRAAFFARPAFFVAVAPAPSVEKTDHGSAGRRPGHIFPSGLFRRRLGDGEVNRTIDAQALSLAEAALTASIEHHGVGSRELL
jgi:hypothetical protein